MSGITLKSKKQAENENKCEIRSPIVYIASGDYMKL